MMEEAIMVLYAAVIVIVAAATIFTAQNRETRIQHDTVESREPRSRHHNISW